MVDSGRIAHMYERLSHDPRGLVARALDAVSLSDDELLQMLSEVQAVTRLVDAAGVRLAAEVAHRSRRELGGERLSARRGCRNAAELVRRATGVSGASAGRRIRLGLATRPDVGLAGGEIPAQFPAVAGALAAGALGVEAAHTVVTTLEPTLRVANPSTSRRQRPSSSRRRPRPGPGSRRTRRTGRTAPAERR